MRRIPDPRRRYPAGASMIFLPAWNRYPQTSDQIPAVCTRLSPGVETLVNWPRGIVSWQQRPRQPLRLPYLQFHSLILRQP